MGSNPIRVAIFTFNWAGKCASVAQSVEQGTENPCVTSSILVGGTKNLICGSGSVVERHLAKVNVASSNLVFRSKKSTNFVGVFFMRKNGRDENEQSSSEQPESRVRLSGLWSREHEAYFRKRLAAVGNKRERTVPSFPLQKIFICNKRKTFFIFRFLTTYVLR